MANLPEDLQVHSQLIAKDLEAEISGVFCQKSVDCEVVKKKVLAVEDDSGRTSRHNHC